MITSDQSNELIRESVSNFKLEQSKKRRKMVQKMLDYYAGASTF